MKKWEVKYRTPNAGAERSQLYTIEASNKHEANEKFMVVYPCEEIISIEEVVQ